MTHFTVLVKFEGDISEAEDRIEQMLAPYDENTEVERYKKRIPAREIKDACKYFNIPNTNNARPTFKQLKEYFGSEVGKDAKGYFRWSTYNKKSKWDWYQVGGRWQGMLTLKNGALGNYVRQPNLGKHDLPFTEQLKRVKGTDSVKVDIAYLKDVDFAGMSAKEKKDAEETYYRAVENIEKALEKGTDLDKAFGINFFELGVQNETLEEHLARVGGFATHSVVDEKGWHEWSKMGWWAVTYDENETEADWHAKFEERFLSNPTDKTVIAVIDAHI